MIASDKIWFIRGGLFAKYVMALVGLVVFVLAVNGLTETWINYRATKTGLTDAMSEKAARPPPNASTRRSPSWSSRSAG
jgi:adenylate cyclase